ncbi:MAG: tryptophanase, partial [Cetobacterium sp.]
MAIKYVPEPFRIKMVETIKMTTPEERAEKIKEANYNLFNLKGEDVYIDLLTDSGTNAMSQDQWAGVMRGDEAYAGASSYFNLVNTAKEVFGYEFIQPVHQGRAAEKVLFPTFLKPGQYAISNMFFDTTRAHVILAGARPLDCVVAEAKDPAKRSKFKGNMDVAKMERLILEHGPEKIGLVVLTITNNSAGGQPVSLQNAREVAALCKKYNIPLDIDAARFAENAYFIKRDEPGCENMSIKEIVKEIFSYADFFTMSAKKDTIVNMGGLIGVKDATKNAEIILKIK